MTEASVGLSQAQARATDPGVSAFVAAHAGSGKTHVLAWRVIRLLLAGVAPSRILCLTFTKAAAALMANRIFGVLSRWATESGERLAREIAEVTGKAADERAIARARALFALALDTPGGLKIQTLHAFCESLLRQLPLEAGAPAGFRVLEDAETRELAGEARRQLLADIETGAAGAAVAGAFARLAAATTEDTLDKMLTEAIAVLRRRGPDPATAQAALWHKFGFDAAETDEEWLARNLAKPLVADADLIRLADAAEQLGDKNSLKFAADARAALDRDLLRQLVAWRELLFTDKFTPIKNPLKKDIAVKDKAAADNFRAGIEAAQRLVLAWNDRRLLGDTHSLLFLAEAAAERFLRLKRARNGVEFDDLIEMAENLLARADIGAWVRYKLDRGIDHILIDEAQDTNPRQWRIIDALTGDFFAGEGAADRPRTLFAVGDEKQSIFSFQGAAPEYFPKQEARYRAAAGNAGLEFRRENLRVSYRSTPDILAAVDRVFAADAHRAGLGEGEMLPHSAQRQLDRGETWIWPMIGNPETPDREDWVKPIDAPSEGQSSSRLAERIAETIAGWLAAGDKLPAHGRPIRPRDILVLVRKRNAFVTSLIRKLRERGVPVAGADRLLLTEHIATEDLVAIGRSALLPADDLSLAGALKSPLFHVSEEELQRLAAARGNVPLHARLKAIAASDGPDAALARRILAIFEPLAAEAPVARAYEFYSRLLGAGGLRQAMLASLGNEAEDVLDAFEQAAMAHEDAGGLSLQEFLASLERASPELKREADSRVDEVRVMTVHGAKGLEAPIVFVVDPGSAAVHANHLPKLLEVEGGGVLWATGGKNSGKDSHGLIEGALRRERTRAEGEYRRLLYVALTRAADRLIVCGHFARRRQSVTWHTMVESQLAAMAERREDAAGNVTLVWQSADPQLKALAKDKPLAGDSDPREDGGLARPAWLDRPAAPEIAPPRPLSPSQAGTIAGAPAFYRNATEATREARDRGIAMHSLLQHLPAIAAEKRSAAAAAFLKRAFPLLGEEVRRSLAADAEAVLNEPRLAKLFDRGSRAEVDIAGMLAVGGRDLPVAGRIDRIAFLPGEILFADFKTGEGDDPAWRVQMALYGALLQQIHPAVTIRGLLVFTRNCSAVELTGADFAGELSRLGGAWPNMP
jgi:ATP-dependent helicase/nuclease subunit A